MLVASSDAALLAARARLFVVSYAALWLMFAARFGGTKRWELMAAFGVVGLWALVDGWRLVRGTLRRSRSSAVVSDLVDQGGSVSSYLATYLLPFLGNLPQNAGDWVAYVLYFAVALIIYIKSDLALINPTLYLFRYHVVRGRVGSRQGLIVSAGDIKDGDRVSVSEFIGVLVIHKVTKVNDNA